MSIRHPRTFTWYVHARQTFYRLEKNILGAVSITADSTALLITDPQVDFLNPESAVWDEIEGTVKDNEVADRLATAGAESTPLETDGGQ